MKSTVADSVLHALRARYAGMTDAELASLLRKRHQHINQTCRALAGQGLIARDSTSNGIINRATGDAAPQRAATAGTTADRDWNWEGNVQSRIAAHLAASGWTIISTADTANRERGADIIAERGGQQMLAEVKGWPHGTARTSSPLQASHSFAGALTTLIRRGGSTRLAIGLPDMPRYRTLLSEASWALGRLGIMAYLVESDGTVVLWDGTGSTA